MDKRAFKTPSHLEHEIDDLSAYLSKGLDDKVENLRVIWRWVTNNIKFNVKALNTNRLS